MTTTISITPLHTMTTNQLARLPDDARVAYRSIEATVFHYERGDKMFGIAFGGKRSNPDYHYRFNTEDNRINYAKGYLNRLESRGQLRKERTATMHRPSELKVGDILVSSWGYEQTNVNFYLVTKTIGKRTVKIRELGHTTVPGSAISHGMACNVVADRLRFIGDELTKVVSNGNQVKISYYKTAYLWDGRPQYKSWYA